MSLDAHAAHPGTPVPPHSHGDASGHGTFRGYVTGFALSVVLTAIPFILVMGNIGSPNWIAFWVLALGVVQIVVHMVYFLHMNSKSEGGWTMLAMIFTAILVVIALAGSLWVMYHLEENMMPMTPEQVRQMP